MSEEAVNSVKQNEIVDFDANREACDIIFASIAKYPQDSRGSVLIADKIMRAYDSGAKSHTVDVSDVSNINPDGDEYAPKINEVHRIFREKFHAPIPDVTSEQARTFISDFAISSMDRIRHYTIDVAEDFDRPIPELLRQPVMKTQRPDGEKHISPNWINKDVTAQLDSFLRQNPDISDSVSVRLRAESEEVRKDSHNQQRRGALGEAANDRF